MKTLLQTMKFLQNNVYLCGESDMSSNSVFGV